MADQRLDELQRIQQECAAMVTTLKALHEEEITLRKGNTILAQQAILLGSKGAPDRKVSRGRRGPAAGSKKATAAEETATKSAEEVKS
eukprot:g2890.t1 g2890   contig12:1002015-1002278(-)